MVPSNIENKVKRIQYKKIENIDDVRYTKYIDEFDDKRRCRQNCGPL